MSVCIKRSTYSTVEDQRQMSTPKRILILPSSHLFRHGTKEAELCTRLACILRTFCKPAKGTQTWAFLNDKSGYLRMCFELLYGLQKFVDPFFHLWKMVWEASHQDRRDWMELLRSTAKHFVQGFKDDLLHQCPPTLAPTRDTQWLAKTKALRIVGGNSLSQRLGRELITSDAFAFFLL